MHDASTQRRLPPPPWAVVGVILWDIALDFCWFYGMPPRRRHGR